MKKIIILILVLVINTFTHAEEWDVKRDAKNSVKFTSSTTVLDFDGVTDKIDGYIYWEGDKIFSGKNELYFEVDLNTVKTGIGKRDRDMREDVLETDKWPKTYFKGTIVSASKTDSSNSYDIIAKGKMFIHGVEKEMKIPAVIKLQNGTMNVQTRFSVFLKDYNIKAPSLLAFIKVAEEIRLSLNFYLQKSAEKNN